MITVALLLLVVAGLTTALIATEEDPPSSFRSTSQKDCSLITGTDSTKELRRIVPRAQSFSVSVLQSTGNAIPLLTCEVRADDRLAVKLTVISTSDDQQEWAEEITKTDLAQPSDRHRVKLYGGGFTGPHAATLYVPCSASGAGRQHALDVKAIARRGTDHEKDLLKLARRAAKHATGTLGCEK
ncbi:MULTISPECIES: hypothetical protein [unclassified Streptomyces]|uniref:hypothetical protein n=1 Tax=unclassified Streptomyces TaxID=2593676 RepID=UPI002DDBFCC3|nr:MULTISPECIES: hypothetical protein [unclassified Streptomyces]WSA94023.1 hypothetical protein OIE63_22410 [Streptomyces sp. NBC_01795]WSB78448.1 hypothetical protein OHB04_23540 [Streptomyces sp. NBC_01775]WSS13350.1 hypothetical protein OG533_16700 [Streptomyces sp. NBC_01186]WSS42139.1 hypothetical protein OG220_17260 [Streptomyces sp. NBC_01187]